LNNYTLIKESFNEHQNGMCRLYRHSSGAKVVHFENDDPNCASALSFHTPTLSGPPLACICFKTIMLIFHLSVI